MSKSPPLKEFYARLGLSQGASLDEIKKAYRQKAFELHPDLNPSAGAGRQFQQLNEAYVVLIRLLGSQQAQTAATAKQRPGDPKASASTASQAYQEQARREEQERQKERRQRQEREFQERTEAERRARERREREEESRRREEKRLRLHEEIERQEQERQKRREQAKRESERKAQEREQARLRQAEREAQRESAREPRPESHKRTYAKSAATANNGTAGSADDLMDEAARESLLSDLLNDAFARRVYEDIYSEVRNRRSSQAEAALAADGEEAVEADNPLVEFTRTVGDNLKGWLRDQIDEQQILYYPASKLFPGARILLQIRHGFSHKQKTFEVVLPADFLPGKPVRLRGMGKKLGKWQGDLYLIFQIKN